MSADRTDAGRAVAARARVEVAIDLLQAARSEIATLTLFGAPQGHPGLQAIDKATGYARRAFAHLDILIKRLP